MNAHTAGDFDYDAGGGGYALQRRTDPRIAALVHAALGEARTVLNVGAGAGSYEPEDRDLGRARPGATGNCAGSAGARSSCRPLTATPSICSGWPTTCPS